MQPGAVVQLLLQAARSRRQPAVPTTRATRRRRSRSPTTTTTDGVTVPFIVRAGDRLHRPRPVRDRRRCASRASRGAVGAADAVQPPARHHPRRELRHDVRQPAARPTCMDDDSARRAASSSMSQRARQRRPQLQHRHAGRVAGHDQGARHRPATATSAGRSAAAARAARSCSSRSPTPTRASTRASRRSAASPTRGRRRCSTSTTRLLLQLLRGPVALGARHGVGPDRDQPGARPPERRQPGHLHDGHPQQRRPEPLAARACRPTRSTTRRPTRTA